MRTIITWVILIFTICLGYNAPADGFYDISGTVTGQDGKPLAGATVSLSGVEKVTAAGDDGRFVFHNVGSGTFTLYITMIGYVSDSQKVKVKDAPVVVNVMLKTDMKELKEVDITSKQRFTIMQVRMSGGAGRLAASVTDRNIYDSQGNVVDPAKAAEMEKTFEYHTNVGQINGQPTLRHVIRKINPDLQTRIYQTINNIPELKVKSAKLQVGATLKLKPIARRVDTTKLVGKAIVMIFWRPAHPGEPMYDQYHDINNAIAPYANSGKLQVIAITHLGFDKAADELKYNPILNAQLITGAPSINYDYETNDEPMLIMTDTSHKIILSATRHVFETAWMLHQLLKEDLN
jgi:hypothetical protein